MKIIGRLEAVYKYVFAITTGFMRHRIDVYVEDLNGYHLEPTQLNTKSVTSFNSFLLASGIFTGKGILKETAGKFEVLTQVLNILESTEALTNLISGRMGVDSYTFQTAVIEVEAVNKDIATTTHIPGLQYTPVTQLISNRSIVAGANRDKVKTFAEVIKDHDMSWYYDQQGNCKKDYRLVQSIDELKELMSDAALADVIALDTETTGTNFYWYRGDATRRSKICGMSLSWKKDQGIYIPFLSNVFDTLAVADAMALVMPVLKKSGMRVVCHNGMFDFRVLYSYGYKIPITDDTLLMEFNIDPNVKKGSKGLKTLTRKYLNHETIELDELTGGKVIPELIPDIDRELIKVYACADTDYTLQLYHILGQFTRDKKSYKLDCLLIDILAIAEYQGTPINKALLRTMADINKRNLQIVETTMHRYVRIIGTQTLAVNAIKAVKGESYEPLAEEIKELCEYQPFLESIEHLFHKAGKGKHSGELEELQFSSPQDISYILYDLLSYPVVKYNDSDQRSSDKEALNKLLEYNAVEPVLFLKDDIRTCAPEFGVNSNEVIISKKVFESKQYPFAYLLATWRKLSKFDSSFFTPLLMESGTGDYFSDNSMTSAETARVTNKIQTLEGSLKELITPRDSDWYLIVFDKSQIEYRVMIGLAATYWNGLLKKGILPSSAANIAKSKDLTALIENLNNWEKDYHREGGAIFAGCTPDTMTKQQRKKIKAIHFSVPYGADAASVAKPKLAGHPESEHAAIIAETEAELSAWRNKMYPLYYFLEHVRDTALTPIAVNPPKHEGIYGKVTNAMGRYRLFELGDISFKEKSSIRRQAGNYPIQSLARDIFFSGIYKLYARLKKEGIIVDKFEDCKAVLSLFVHDEVVIQVHKSIHPYRMYKYIMDTNLTKLPGHPTYFMGIAVTDTWGQGKADKYEAPIDYVYECIAKYDADPSYYDNIAGTVDSLAELDYTGMSWNGIVDWFSKRVCRELAAVQNGSDIIDPVYIGDNLINYYVKSRLAYYSKDVRKDEYKVDPSLPKGKDDMNYNSYIQLFDYYLLVTGEYQKYKLKFNGQIIPYADVLQLEPEEDIVDVNDMDFDFDFDNLSEADEDYAEKESAYADEFYLVSEPRISVHIEERHDTVVKEVENKPSMWCEDVDGSCVFFVTDMTPQQFNKLIAFLKPHRSPNGIPLYFFNGNKVNANCKIIIDFTEQDAYQAVYGTDSDKTSVFGG